MKKNNSHLTLKSFFLLLTLLKLGCDSQKSSKYPPEIQIIPSPKEIIKDRDNDALELKNTISVFIKGQNSKKFFDLFTNDFKKIFSQNLNFKKSEKMNSDISFNIDNSLRDEEYKIEIDKNVIITGGSYNAISMAKSSLLQIIKLKGNKTIILPKSKIFDMPDSSYRGLMIDLSRMWHSIESIRNVIDLASFYKIKYLQLHLSDDQAFVFPTDSFPNLPTPDRPYTKKDFVELVEYAKIRGVTIVPEIDVPGHSRQFIETYPKIFDVNNGIKKSNVINIANEKVYKALDQIIAEVAEVFYNSPFIHMGADEAKLDLYKNVKEVKSFMNKNKLGDDVHELYRYFIVRINEIVKKYDKQMLIWEGFRKEGKIKIPKDIIVFEFETLYNHPKNLIEDGYTLVNASWTPLYAVYGGVKNKMAQRAVWSPERIYKWNKWRWEHFSKSVPGYNPIQLKETNQVIGGQMCSWEQSGEAEIPVLRKRLPVFSERVWNDKPKKSFDETLSTIERTDKILTLIIKDSRQDSILVGFNFKKDGCLWCDPNKEIE
ncbi:family 20 glycosylhydrolase [Bacteroidota bacterium]|nr:family 20 glycosylhydrolase [Bacteroidota bacterium]